MLSKQISTEPIRRFLQYVSLICVFLYVILSTLKSSTTLGSLIWLPGSAAFLFLAEVIWSTAFLSAFLSFLQGWADRTQSRACILSAFLLKLSVLLTGFLCIFMGFSYSAVWPLLAAAIACEAQDERRLLRTALYIGAVTAGVCFVFSMLGLIENNRGDAFGFTFRTHYASYLLSLVLAGCLLSDGLLPWYGELGLVGVFLFNHYFVGGKSISVCLLLILLGTCFRHFKENGGVPFQAPDEYGFFLRGVFQLLYLPIRVIAWCTERLSLQALKRAAVRCMEYSYVIFAALTVLLTRFYRQWMPLANRIPGMDTVKIRFLQGVLAFEEYPVRLFGNSIPQQGWSGTSGSAVDFYYALDSAYVKLLIQLGSLAFLFLLGFMTLTQIRLFKRRRFYALFLLAVFALDGTMNYQMINFSHNWFILLSFCKLRGPGETELAAKKPVRLSGRRGWRVGALTAVCAALFGLWCRTAYPISTWSGTTPARNATLVVSDGYEGGVGTDDLIYRKLESAVRYLAMHGEACCIVSGTSEKADAMAKALVSAGVEEARVYRDAASGTVDEMLVNAHSLIREKRLPARLTVCSFDMFQRRIQTRAKALRIPVNSLSAKMPWQWYLPNFALEQGRSLI